MAYAPIDKEIVIRAFKLRDEGLSRKEVSVLTGLSSSVLCRYFRGKVKGFNPVEHGFAISEDAATYKKHGRNKEIWDLHKDKCIELNRKGFSFSEIRDHLCLTTDEISPLIASLYYRGLYKSRRKEFTRPFQS